ncbi:unnamed protein product, partial [Pocillopora meandrina]
MISSGHQPRSCKEIYDQNSSISFLRCVTVQEINVRVNSFPSASSNKAYTLRLDNGDLPVYCSMSGELGECGDGGWTLNTFWYGSNRWYDRSSFSPQNGDTGLDHLETLLPTYWSTSFTKICLGMKVNGVTRFLQVDKAAASLYDLIADGEYRPTSLGRDEWKTLIGSDASLQLKCNKEGFNSQGTMHRTSSFELESSLIKKTIATSLIPESDLVEEGQDSKTPVETEPRGVRTTETKISRLSATSSF